MLPDRVSNPGPLTYESGALPIALRGPAFIRWTLRTKAPWATCEGVGRSESVLFALFLRHLFIRRHNVP